jgi:hypothetical protein
MNVFFVIFLWLAIAAVLVTGVVMAVYGSFWLLILGVLGFVGGMIKYGILAH